MKTEAPTIETLKPDNLPHRELTTRAGEKLSLTLGLAERFGFRDLFVQHEILPPGRRASSTHAHTHREEMVYVLSGEVVAVTAGRELAIAGGECLGFPPGEGRFHHLENRGGVEARYLLLSCRNDADRVIYDSSVGSTSS